MKFAANPVDTMTFSEILDADWERLKVFAGEEPTRRRRRACFSSRFACVSLVRTAQCLHRSGWRRLAKLVSLANFVIFGIEVPAQLPIGPGLIIPHSHGTIIGAGYIGCNVTIYQQVTFGGKLADFGYNPEARPHLCDGAIITSGAKVLGPVRIGVGAIIGANAVVLKDVPDHAVAVGVPAKIIAPGEAVNRDETQF